MARQKLIPGLSFSWKGLLELLKQNVRLQRILVFLQAKLALSVKLGRQF